MSPTFALPSGNNLHPLDHNIAHKWKHGVIFGPDNFLHSSYLHLYLRFNYFWMYDWHILWWWINIKLISSSVHQLINSSFQLPRQQILSFWLWSSLIFAANSFITHTSAGPKPWEMNRVRTLKDWYYIIPHGKSSVYKCNDIANVNRFVFSLLTAKYLWKQA